MFFFVCSISDLAEHWFQSFRKNSMRKMPSLHISRIKISLTRDVFLTRWPYKHHIRPNNLFSNIREYLLEKYQKANQNALRNKQGYTLLPVSTQTQLLYVFLIWIKGSPDPNHFYFEINVGKSRIRHKTKLEEVIFYWFWVDPEIRHSI